MYANNDSYCYAYFDIVFIQEYYLKEFHVESFYPDKSTTGQNMDDSTKYQFITYGAKNSFKTSYFELTKVSTR